MTEQKPDGPSTPPPGSAAEPQRSEPERPNTVQVEHERLIHDLHVHQVELELQNQELRRAQELLEESRARYADLYDFAPVGYCTLDLEGNLRECNLTCAALLGAPREELVGRPFPVVARLKDRRPFQEHLRRCTREQSRVTSELTLSRRGHGSRELQLVSDPIRDEHGATTAFRTALVDISELKHLQEKLRLLSDAGAILGASLSHGTTVEAVVRLAVPALADFCVVDLLTDNGKIERAAVSFADPQKQAALADRIKQLAPRPGWHTAQERVIASGTPLLLSEPTDPRPPRGAQGDPPDAVIALARARSSMVVPLTARGRALGALTLGTAESERSYRASDLRLALDLASRAGLALDNARLHDEAQRAVAARDAMLGFVSHDLRSPLSVILMRTSAMLKRPSDADRRVETRRVFDSIRRSAERMGRLIRDLLDVSSIEAERFSIEGSPQPVGPVVREAMEALQLQAAQKAIRLAGEFPRGEAFEVTCDRDRIQQVLVNLISNAIKFSKNGGSIVIRADRGDTEACFSVSDTGEGISPTDLPHVFDRFWQAQKTARLGTGLGLSIAKGIVEVHGGRIWVESKLGIGTTFFFTLPLSGTAAAAPRPPEPVEGPVVEPFTVVEESSLADPGKRLVLVAEDDVDVREALGDSLHQAGYEVATVENGADALSYLRQQHRPFSVIVDLNMPVVDGWSFLSERNRDPLLRTIPVVVVSGQHNVADRVAAEHALYLQKPVLLERLIETMEHIGQRAR